MPRLASLMLKELAHRGLNTTLAVAAVAAAVAVCVALAILSDASNRETRRIQRDIGFNLRIIPRDTDMMRFYSTGYAQHTFPESAAAALAERQTLAYNHIVPTLAQRITLDTPSGGTIEAIITGLGEPLYPPGQNKPPMVRPIKAGAVHVGAEIAAALGLEAGDTLEVEGERFEVARVAPPLGTLDDLRLIAALADAQRVLKLEGRINEISAIDCLCVTADRNPQAILRDEIEAVIPEAKVVMLSTIADARARQRQMMAGYAAFITPLALIIAAVWVAVLAMLNVRSRAAEIGVFRAIGYRSRDIAGLLLGKAAVIGLAGALLGYAVGAAAALAAGPSLFQLTARAIDAQPALLLWAALLAPLGAATASFIPTALAVAQDPADTLAAEFAQT